MAKNCCWNDVVELLFGRIFDEVAVENAVIAAEGLSQELDHFLVDHRRVDDAEDPVYAIDAIVEREDAEHDLVDWLVVAVLVEEVGVHGADRVVGAELLLNNKIELAIVAVALLFDEILHERETAGLEGQIVIVGVFTPCCKVLDQ